MKLEELTALQLIKELRSGSLTSEELVIRFLERVEEIDPRLNSYITINDRVVEEARLRDKEGRKGKLAGLPVAVKDNISTKGIRTTCASKILGNYVPPYDAEVISRVKKEGGLILGKTNMDEFGMGSSGENSGFGPTRNPWDLDRVPGGSSSGSASAVASALAPISLGTDTGGSIRAPASFTGMVGLKPTYGAVSRYGLIAYANSLEQVGPLAYSVLDAALLFSIISGEDDKDSTSLPHPGIDLKKVKDFEARGLKGVIPSDLVEGVDEKVRKVFYRSMDAISSLGVEVDEVRLQGLKLALPAYYVIACSEASSNLARYDGVRFGRPCETGKGWREAYREVRGLFGKEVKVRIMLGAHMLSTGYFEEYYVKAIRVRRNIRSVLKGLLEDFNFIALPTMPVLPWKIGEKMEDPLYVYLSDALTVLANLAGVPAISIPAGVADNLPVGVQFMADEFQEGLLLGLGKELEERLGRLRRPSP